MWEERKEEERGERKRGAGGKERMEGDDAQGGQAWWCGAPVRKIRSRREVRTEEMLLCACENSWTREYA